MKHLKKFNESNIQELDKEFLDMVFINFLDRGIQSQLSKNSKVYTIELKYELVSSIGRLKNYLDMAKEDSLELEEGMAKVKIEYPKASYTLYIKDQTIIFKIYDNAGTINSPNPEGLDEVVVDDDNFFNGLF